MIAAATFISNTDNYTYPIEKWKKALKKYPQHIKKYPNNSVKNPGDIATFQNETLQEVFKNYDYCLFVQADIFYKEPKRFDISNYLDDVYLFDVEDIKNNQYLYTHNFGVTLIPKKSNAYFVGDGAYTNFFKKAKITLGYSIGYLSELDFKNHKTQQKKIWNQNSEEDFKQYKERKFINNDPKYSFLFK